MTEISQVFIFCAGRGQRMRHLTDSTPKPLIEVNGKSILGYIIEQIQQIPSIKKIIINGHYLSEKIHDFILKINDPRIVFSCENDKLETGGGLIYALENIDVAQPLLTINGDVLWRSNFQQNDIKKLCDFWDSKNCDILLGLKKTDEYFGYDGNKFGGGDFDLQGRKLYRYERKMDFVYVGLQIINPQILLKILQNPHHPQCFSVNHLYLSAINKATSMLERIEGVELDAQYFHIGTPENLALAENIIKNFK